METPNCCAWYSPRRPGFRTDARSADSLLLGGAHLLRLMVPRLQEERLGPRLAPR